MPMKKIKVSWFVTRDKIRIKISVINQLAIEVTRIV